MYPVLPDTRYFYISNVSDGGDNNIKEITLSKTLSDLLGTFADSNHGEYFGHENMNGFHGGHTKVVNNGDANVGGNRVNKSHDFYFTLAPCSNLYVC